MDIQQRPYEAENIASQADVETLETYESEIDQYRQNDFTYIPMPKDDSYYNVDEESLSDLQKDQFIPADAHLLEAITKLENQEFILIDLEPSYYLVDLKNPHIRGIFDDHPSGVIPDEAELFKPDELWDVYPDLAEKELRNYDDRYMIITVSDLNKRRVREMLYVLIGAISSELSTKIEREHTDSRALFKYLRPGTIGRWEKENLKDLHLHIAEHMTLHDMKQVVQGSDGKFVKECGFDSKNDVTTLNSIENIRNRVMHPNRSLIYERNDVGKVIKAIDESQRILKNMS